MLLAKLKVDFKDVPGELNVARRRFNIYQASGQRTLIDEDNWGRGALPGSKLVMAMMINGHGHSQDHCPLCGALSSLADMSGWAQWCV